jgi:Clp amino terminal domain, pathogenicity island component
LQVTALVGLRKRRRRYRPYTPRAKKVVELSLREALQLGRNDVGTEHLLLALLREKEGVGAQVLNKLGAELYRVRQKVIKLLVSYEPRQTPAERVASAKAAYRWALQILDDVPLRYGVRSKSWPNPMTRWGPSAPVRRVFTRCVRAARIRCVGGALIDALNGNVTWSDDCSWPVLVELSE